MKRLIIILMGILANTCLISQEMTGDDIIQKVNEVLSPNTSYGKSSMTIVTTSGDKRTFVMESWSKNKGENA